jgi:hypothetical protein
LFEEEEVWTGKEVAQKRKIEVWMGLSPAPGFRAGSEEVVPVRGRKEAMVYHAPTDLEPSPECVGVPPEKREELEQTGRRP